MSSSPLIEVKNLTKKYGKRTALDSVDLNIYQGEVYGICGPNGAGKSTLISIIASLIKPTSGEVLINQVSVTTDPQVTKRQIGLAPQEIALYNRLTGMENLIFWARVYGLSGEELHGAIRQALELTGLSERLKDPVEKYSGGMKRRLNIATALLHKPSVLILDEPTSGVDLESRQRIMQNILQLSEQGVTVIFVSHHFDELQSVCTRIALLEEGKVAIVGVADDVLPRLTGAYIDQEVSNH